MGAVLLFGGRNGGMCGVAFCALQVSLRGLILYVRSPCNTEDCSGRSGSAELYYISALVEFIGFFTVERHSGDVT